MNRLGRGEDSNLLGNVCMVGGIPFMTGWRSGGAKPRVHAGTHKGVHHCDLLP